MISPSEAQHQEQPPRANNLRETDRPSHIRLQKGPKPLERKIFYLDIKNHALATKLEAKIKELGGVIELFLVKSVTLVVSDRVDKSGQACSDRRKWGWTSGGSGGSPSLRSIEAPTPMPNPLTPSLNIKSPLANSTNLWGQTAQRSKSRADAMLERALTQPQQCSVDPLKNAVNWGIPIWATEILQAWLDKIYTSVKNTNNLKRARHVSSNKDFKVKHLKAPYIKFESFRRDTRPVFLELSSWPTLNFDGSSGSCPFDTKRREKKENNVISKEVKENKETTNSAKQNKNKEMTRRPRATATRACRTEQLVAGYCEICRIEYRDLSKHVQSDQHLSFIRNDDNFLSLDTLINAGANVEAFLKLNRTKDIGKDCNLFPNGGRSLRSIVLPDTKVDKTAKSGLDNFGVEEINMVQCNGARRNLNLKLSSPHNLRTRAKHESGHLLRSKGSPWHEVEKSDKFYDKFEGFTIKKRAKGTIWIEEEDPDEKCVEVDDFKDVKRDNNKDKEGLLSELNGSDCKNKDVRCLNSGQNNLESRHSRDLKCEENCVREQSCLMKYERLEDNRSSPNNEIYRSFNGDVNVSSVDCTTNINGYEINGDSCKCPEACKNSKDNDLIESDENLESKYHKSSLTGHNVGVNDSNGLDVICSENDRNNSQDSFKTPHCTEKESKEERPRNCRTNRRGGRTSRGRHRLSVEERLIEDNRAYYKVEVLGNKLRSSTVPGNNCQNLTLKDVTVESKKDDEIPSSEKPVVVRFKRVRKSELSLLSDEAESFMFGEVKRDDSSEDSEDDRSSVLPRDTESECDVTANSLLLSSSINSSSPMKQEVMEEDSQDSTCLGRARKRRRTQAEALIKDNADYYKFETPGSRLRYQAPIAGIKESGELEKVEKTTESRCKLQVEAIEKLYPSKPSPEVEKMQFSFEAIPKSEPWYQTYQRQDEGAEFWHYFSEDSTQKPFLLPYEIENFHETLIRGGFNKSEGRKKGRGRGGSNAGRSPRKSPRCHASTLAIMSTIIRKREQQQQSPSLSIIEEESQTVRLQENTPKLENKVDLKIDVDEELREIAKNIDEMLSAKHLLELEDSFELDCIQFMESNLEVESIMPKGPPPNLIELLDNCHEIGNYLENSSCASSECGEVSVELPLKRRKKRKNRTGWPGIKMRKKLQNKQLIDADCERENVPDEKIEKDNRVLESLVTEDISNRLQSNSSKGITELNSNGQSDSEQQQDQDKLHESGINAESCSSKISNKDSSNEIVMKRHKSLENSDREVLSRNLETCDDCTKCDVYDGTDKDSLLSEDLIFSKRNVSKVGEVLENSLTSDENHENSCRKDTNSSAMLERQQNSKSTTKKRQRGGTILPDTRNSHSRSENDVSLCRKDISSVIVSRKHHCSDTLSKKHQQRETMSSETCDSNLDIEHHENSCRKDAVVSRKQVSIRKSQRKDVVSSEMGFEVEQCKKDSYLSISARKQQSLRNVKCRRETVSSETRDTEVECSLSVSERVSPPIISSTKLEHRRSSIEFQPVVRMMKIDNQVDMDHGILSVTVASNRRLRSSSTPRSNVQPPTKRMKTARGQFGRWIKNS